MVFTIRRSEISPGVATLVDGLAQSGRGFRVQKQQNLTYLGYRADVVTKTSEISPGVATLVDALTQSGHGLRVQKQRDLTYLGHRADEVTKTSEISPGVATHVDALAQSGRRSLRFRNSEISPILTTEQKWSLKRVKSHLVLQHLSTPWHKVDTGLHDLETVKSHLARPQLLTIQLREDMVFRVRLR